MNKIWYWLKTLATKFFWVPPPSPQTEHSAHNEVLVSSASESVKDEPVQEPQKVMAENIQWIRRNKILFDFLCCCSNRHQMGLDVPCDPKGVIRRDVKADCGAASTVLIVCDPNRFLNRRGRRR